MIRGRHHFLVLGIRRWINSPVPSFHRQCAWCSQGGEGNLFTPCCDHWGSLGREILDKDSGCEFTPSTASCSPPRLVESTWTLPPPLYFRLPLPILLELPSRTWTVVCRGIARGRQCWGVGPSCGGSGPLVVPWSGRIPRRRRPCPCVPCERSGSWRCGPCDSAIRVNSVE